MAKRAFLLGLARVFGFGYAGCGAKEEGAEEYASDNEDLKKSAHHGSLRSPKSEFSAPAERDKLSPLRAPAFSWRDRLSLVQTSK